MAELAQQLKVKLFNLVQRVTGFKFGSSQEEKENMSEENAKLGPIMLQSRAAEIDGSAKLPKVPVGSDPGTN